MEGKDIDKFLEKLPDIDDDTKLVDDDGVDGKQDDKKAQKDSQQADGDEEIVVVDEGASGDSGDGDADGDKQETQKRKRKGNDFQSRLRKMDAEKHEALDIAARAVAEKMAQDEELAKLRRYAVHLENASLDQLEISAKAQKESAKAKLIKAKEDNDPKAEADASAELAEAAAYQARVAEHKIRVKSNEVIEGKDDGGDDDKQDKTRQPERKQTQDRQPAPTPNQRNTQAWLQENSWFNSRSDDYDEEMATDVQKYAKNLENEFREKGQEHKIGGYDYFKKIDNYRAGKFGLFEDEDEGDFDLAEQKRQDDKKKQQQGKRPQMRQGNDGVASQRRDDSMSRGTKEAPKKVVLSAIERDIALSVFANQISEKTGKLMTDQEKLAYYYKQKVNDENRAKDSFQLAELRKAGIKV